MLALWLEEQAVRLRDDVPAPDPAPGEARIRVLRAGICNTDLELVRGYYSFTGILGHEFVGRVESAPGAEEWVGRRVVGEINAVCGACAMCRAGRRTHCEKRTVLGILGRDGSFAEALSLPLANLHDVPDELPDEVAVFTEPTAAVLEIQEQVRIMPDHRVVVIGDGKLGNLVAQTLALTGCSLLVVGRHRSKLDLLAARGIRTCLTSELEGRFDVVVECTGSPEGFALARRAVRPRGTVVLKSTHRGETPVNFSSVVVDELTLVGSRCVPSARHRPPGPGRPGRHAPGARGLPVAGGPRGPGPRGEVWGAQGAAGSVRRHPGEAKNLQTAKHASLRTVTRP